MPIIACAPGVVTKKLLSALMSLCVSLAFGWQSHSFRPLWCLVGEGSSVSSLHVESSSSAPFIGLLKALSYPVLCQRPAGSGCVGLLWGSLSCPRTAGAVFTPLLICLESCFDALSSRLLWLFGLLHIPGVFYDSLPFL